MFREAFCFIIGMNGTAIENKYCYGEVEAGLKIKTIFGVQTFNLHDNNINTLNQFVGAGEKVRIGFTLNPFNPIGYTVNLLKTRDPNFK